MDLLGVLGSSRWGSVPPAVIVAWTSSVQQSSLHTISSCGLSGKGRGGARQLACHTMLHRVHSVSIPPWSHASHWSFRSPSQCRFGTQSRATIWCVGTRGCVVRWRTPVLLLRTVCPRVLCARSSSSSGVGVDLFCPLQKYMSIQ